MSNLPRGREERALVTDGGACIPGPTTAERPEQLLSPGLLCLPHGEVGEAGWTAPGVLFRPLTILTAQADFCLRSALPKTHTGG